MSVAAFVLLGVRGAAAILVLTTLVGGIPRVVQAALVVSLGAWSALVLAPGHGIAPTWAHGVQELAIGAAIGVVAAVPLLAAAAAGRLVDTAATGRAQGTYGVYFGLLAAAVFVGVDGHVRVVTAIVRSHETLPMLAATRPGVLAALAALVPIAVQLAVPWLVTAAVVQIAVGVGARVSARASEHAPMAVAVPAALTMMTAALVATLAVAMAVAMRPSL